MSTYIIVSHSHLDREWYRSFEGFRARLVDMVDQVLELSAQDPDFVFVLDGQTVVLEDYLEQRPQRRDELVAAVRAGRVSIGPWYVQPDGFIPGGELIIRNLLEGRASGAPFGPLSNVGYLPDTFGHPAQLPMIMRGFGLDAFCFRRGLGDESDHLPSEFRWEGPDGTSILTLYLAKGYSGAAFLPADPDAAAARLATVGQSLVTASTGDTVLLMNGCDHTFPTQLADALAMLAKETGAEVRRGRVDDAVPSYIDQLAVLPVHRGELRGARQEALLHGVLSTRTYLKLANARCELALVGWAEPFAALAAALGARDERPALRSTRRELLHNHAHDSLCGTSIDPVHREMEVRFARAEERAKTTAERALHLIAGSGPSRPGTWNGGVDLAVFNPNPSPVSGLVRWWVDADPPYAVEDGRITNPPLIREVLAADGFEVDGRPVRLITRPNERLFVWHSDQDDRGIEAVVHDLPAFGWTRLALRPAAAAPDAVDDGREIACGDLSVLVADDGTLTMRAGDRQWRGLLGLEDQGDRGDSYDFSPVGDVLVGGRLVSVERRRHRSGIEQLIVTRSVLVPARLQEGDRSRRADELVDVAVRVVATVHPGTRGVEVAVEVDNVAEDHRLRLQFPMAGAGTVGRTQGPFHVIERPVETRPRGRWTQPPARTFPAHGFVTIPGSGLAVVAPGLLEAEVDGGGVLSLTLVRAIGWLGHDGLPERGVVGPAMRVPDGQCSRTLKARLILLPAEDETMLPAMSQAASLGLEAVVAGASPRWPAGQPLLTLTPEPLVLTALKPSEDGRGLVARIWNPSGATVEGRLQSALPVVACASVRLDEEPDLQPVLVEGGLVRFAVAGQGVRSVLLEVRA
jgi:alpha-mannosidase